jgi:aspartate racemase
MKEKVIGILGGMGPEATLQLFRKILENTASSRDQDYARIIIDNNPKIPERLPGILGMGEDPLPMMVESGRALERAGADFIVIPCVSAHFFLSRLTRKLRLPILSMIEETVACIARHQPPLARLGLLAAAGTIRAGLFQDRLLGAGIESLLPGSQDLQTVQADIFRIKDTKSGRARGPVRKEILEVASRLVERGAQAMIVGCTELSLIIQAGDLPVPIFDALNILAIAAIRAAGLTPADSP